MGKGLEIDDHATFGSKNFDKSPLPLRSKRRLRILLDDVATLLSFQSEQSLHTHTYRHGRSSFNVQGHHRGQAAAWVSVREKTRFSFMLWRETVANPIYN